MTPHQHRRQVLTYRARSLRLEAAALRARARAHDHLAHLHDLKGCIHIADVERSLANDLRNQACIAQRAATAIEPRRDQSYAADLATVSTGSPA